jgi:hypothetical protein
MFSISLFSQWGAMFANLFDALTVDGLYAILTMTARQSVRFSERSLLEGCHHCVLGVTSDPSCQSYESTV